MKKCNKCGEDKELSQFSKEKSRKDGLQPSCKECVKEYRKTNADKLKEQKKQHYKANADKFKQYRKANADKLKQYQKANADKIKEYNKQYKKANADKRKEHNKKYQKANADKLKRYRKTNADKLKEQKKQYRKANADKIKEHNKQYHQSLKEQNTAHLKSIIEPNKDDKYIYVQSFQEGVYKVGISNDVIRRNHQLSLQGVPSDNDLEILYIGKVRKGRTKDAEKIIHHELKEFNYQMIYLDGTNSVEWFCIDLKMLLDNIKQYATLKHYVKQKDLI